MGNFEAPPWLCNLGPTDNLIVSLQGLMLETTSERLLQPGMAHHNCPDKVSAFLNLFTPNTCFHRHRVLCRSRNSSITTNNFAGLVQLGHMPQCVQVRPNAAFTRMRVRVSTQVPAARLATIEAAGRAQVPFTTGVLIGIGETREERLDALFAIRDLHARYGHIQVILDQTRIVSTCLCLFLLV